MDDKTVGWLTGVDLCDLTDCCHLLLAGWSRSPVLVVYLADAFIPPFPRLLLLLLNEPTASHTSFALSRSLQRRIRPPVLYVIPPLLPLNHSPSPAIDHGKAIRLLLGVSFEQEPSQIRLPTTAGGRKNIDGHWDSIFGQ
jgi:hypothetical protein